MTMKVLLLVPLVVMLLIMIWAGYGLVLNVKELISAKKIAARVKKIKKNREEESRNV